MRKRPLGLFFCALLFLYFPLEFYWRWRQGGEARVFDLILSVVLPIILLCGLIRVNKFGWYTLVALVSLWGVEDLYQYYNSATRSITPLLVHIGIYCISLGYFINPRVRHLYFDPKLRWWRAKPRYETHLPFLMNLDGKWHHPILRNVSEGGCFIETPHLPELNSNLKIAVPLPVPLNVSVIKAEGEVKWVSDNPLRHGIGVQFLKPAPQTAKALRQYVRKQL